MTRVDVPATLGRAPLPGLPAVSRPDPPSAWAASVAFGWRALLKIRHVPEMLLDVIAIPVVFTLMFTYLFGGALAGAAYGITGLLWGATLGGAIPTLFTLHLAWRRLGKD